ncbi:MAG TPA: sterol desaturase family protein [Chitinophagales bacterium]|nr:sterol desaturase family protein [Chitinophagales bacterium]
MDSYGKILLYYAIPYFTISMVIELIFARYKGEQVRLMDSVSSLSSGMSNILKDTLKLSVSIITYSFLLKHVQLFHWSGVPVWVYLIAFVCIDFAGYWVHRIEHTVNYFWNQHIIHHSSEEFNLPCALRQSFSGFINFFTIFYLPMALLGVPTQVVAIIAPVHLFMQFWYHTRYINRLGFLEKIIVTPSHHRVHHAMNDIYMDKNYGQIFIFWDKLFGTFQEELPNVEPIYGVKRPVKTWNPFLINYKHMFLLFTDAWRTQSFKDKLRIWFMPTGWRPADVAAKYPVPYVQDMAAFQKFDPVYSPGFVGWSLFQMLSTLGLLCFLFYQMGHISYTQTLTYGGFLLLSIFAYTAVMDKQTYGVALSMAQSALGLGIILITNDWFGIKDAWGAGTTVVAFYFILSAAANLYFAFTEIRKAPGIEMAVETA